MLRPIIKTMRPRQWTKNVFVLAAVVFDRQLPNPGDLFLRADFIQLVPLLRTLTAFAIFCFVSSSVYILNDIFDVEADRLHPIKRNRPIAAGRLPIPVALIAAAVLLLFSFPFAYVLSPWFALLVAAYFVMNLAYSRWLKHVLLIDVFIIATGFVLRVAGGVLALENVDRFSPWLYVVTTLLALYIGFGKRRAELALLTSDANTHRRVLDGYSLPLLDQLITIVSATTVVAYSLYTFSAPNVPDNHSMMLTVPFVLYGIFRYLWLIQMRQAGGEPEELLLTDRPLQISFTLWALSVLLIFYIF